MTRCARSNRVFFWEEPIFDVDAASLEVQKPFPGLWVLVPHLPGGLSLDEICRIQEWLLAQLVSDHALDDYLLWYYTPMALHFSRQLRPQAIVYDCMDELSAFRGAPPGIRSAEDELFSRADVVFTGGQSLYEAKKVQHPNVHCCPSSIDRKFFETARVIRKEPQDQLTIPYPRLGYSGVIDERMDLDLLGTVAYMRSDWHFVMLGPVVKISPSELPKLPNIHYLGSKEYRTLPAYMAGWQVGLLPFARNESTRFISPTKTPEYLAAGLPVISTSIADVVKPYGSKGLVNIADDGNSFVSSVERALRVRYSHDRLAKVDEFLAEMSWDHTWLRMVQLIASTVFLDDSSLIRERSTEALLGTQ